MERSGFLFSGRDNAEPDMIFYLLFNSQFQCLQWILVQIRIYRVRHSCLTTNDYGSCGVLSTIVKLQFCFAVSISNKYISANSNYGT